MLVVGCGVRFLCSSVVVLLGCDCVYAVTLKFVFFRYVAHVDHVVRWLCFRVVGWLGWLGG